MTIPMTSCKMVIGTTCVSYIHTPLDFEMSNKSKSQWNLINIGNDRLEKIMTRATSDEDTQIEWGQEAW